jgi:integrase
VSHRDIEALHRRVSVDATYQANRTVALLSRMFNLSVRWGWRADDPAKGIERNQETKRHRYLSADELARLMRALVLRHSDYDSLAGWSRVAAGLG